MPYPYASDRDEILSRLRKIEGQIRGIHKMVSEGAYCNDILTQISAVVSGMEKVGLRVLREHMTGTLQTKAPTGEKVDEVVKVVERFLSS